MSICVWQADGGGAAYTAVGTVRPSPLLGCLVDLDVRDNEFAGVERLQIGVGLSVSEEAEHEVGRLDGPASAGDAELLACNSPSISTHTAPTPQAPALKRTLSGSSDGAIVPPHRDSLLVLLDILKELDGTLELPAVNGLGGLAGVLEGNAEVGTAGAGRLGGLNLSRSVSHLLGNAMLANALRCVWC